MDAGTAPAQRPAADHPADIDRIVVRNLYKIFGSAPDEALRQIAAGRSKDEVHEATGSVVAINDVSFAVEPGRIFVVMGLSGSGKSTLVRCINRLIPATAGEILIDGVDVVGCDKKTLRDIRLNKVSMVFQHFALMPHKTVAENVEYGLKIKGADADTRRRRALEALETVGLSGWGDVPPGNLSGGMRQRVGLARALAVDPEVMLFDEPFSALDPLIRRDMQNEVIRLHRELEKTIIFISHDLHEALMLGDSVAIMRDGSFVQVGTPEEIVGSPADDYVSAFTQDVDRGRVFTVGSIMRRAHTLVLGEDNLESAITKMRDLGADAMYAVDKGSKRPLGLITGRDAAHALIEKNSDLRNLVRDDFPTAREAEQLHEVYDRCRAGLPLAVVNEAGDLRGVVRPRDVLLELSKTG
jgi:glycine betaine/proline transport system ATP-binding protein